MSKYEHLRKAHKIVLMDENNIILDKFSLKEKDEKGRGIVFGLIDSPDLVLIAGASERQLASFAGCLIQRLSEQTGKPVAEIGAEICAEVMVNSDLGSVLKGVKPGNLDELLKILKSAGVPVDEIDDDEDDEDMGLGGFDITLE